MAMMALTATTLTVRALARFLLHAVGAHGVELLAHQVGALHGVNGQLVARLTNEYINAHFRVAGADTLNVCACKTGTCVV